MAERAAIAIAAHPDDIEFTMAGTLLRLREAGWEAFSKVRLVGACSDRFDRVPEPTRLQVAQVRDFCDWQSDFR